MIEYLAETGSTSSDLAERLRGGELVPDGHWLVADRQTAGRGRQGRTWLDAAGNFMGSTVLHLRDGDPPAPGLALVAGLAVHAAVARRLPDDAEVRLKWPNDVMLAGAKLAGILLERVGDSVVIGIGANLVAAPRVDGRDTAALLSPESDAPDRDGFAADLARQFVDELERWRTFGLEPVRSRWLAVAHPLGTALTVDVPGEGLLAGAFAGLADDGSLQLRAADGKTRLIQAGDVRLPLPEA